MAQNDTGIYQLDGGGWGFRYTISVDGKRKDVKRVRDANGNPMKTKRSAILARAEAIKEEQTPKAKQISRKTVKEVYEEYCGNGRKDRAYRTKPYELRLMVDGIQSSKFIPQSQARAITQKITDLADNYTKASLNRQAFVH